MQHLKTIRLYGDMGKRFGRVHRFAIGSPAEAVRALMANYPAFRAYLANNLETPFRVLVGKEAVGADQLADPAGSSEVIKIVPLVVGAGNFGKIILGAALIYFSAGIAAPFAGLGVTAAGVASFGFSLILSGVSGLLFKPPKPKSAASSERPNNQPSYIFNGAVNTVAQGNAVPILYGGPMIVGSQVVSTGLSVEQISA